MHIGCPLWRHIEQLFSAHSDSRGVGDARVKSTPNDGIELGIPSANVREPARASYGGAERMAEIVRELSYAGGAKSAKIPLLDYLSSELW
jgi:hypothetical protein